MTTQPWVDSISSSGLLLKSSPVSHPLSLFILNTWTQRLQDQGCKYTSVPDEKAKTGGGGGAKHFLKCFNLSLSQACTKYKKETRYYYHHNYYIYSTWSNYDPQFDTSVKNTKNIWNEEKHRANTEYVLWNFSFFFFSLEVQHAHNISAPHLHFNPAFTLRTVLISSQACET